MKYIYLDQKIWIEFAQCIIKGTDDLQKAEAISLAKKNVKDGKWAFPLSIIHLLETSKRRNMRSRKELSHIMGEYSLGYTIAPYMSYKSAEFFLIMKIINGIENNNQYLKDYIIKKDFLNAVGLSSSDMQIEGFPEAQAKLIKKDFFDYIQGLNTFEIHVDMFSADKYAIEIEQQNDMFAQLYGRGRAELFNMASDKHKEYRYRIFALNTFRDFFIDELELIYNQLSNIGQNPLNAIPATVFESKDSAMKFLHGAPSFHVHTQLTYEILNSKQRPLTGNDYMDITFLASAIPYCDAVVTERSWKAIAEKYKLDKSYNTRMCSKLDDLLLIQDN